MSNGAVGSIYAEIIAKVVEASSNDFEESGIDQATLAELKVKWQERLSSFRVADFPWDPKPQPQAQGPSSTSLPPPKTEEDAAPASSFQPPPNPAQANGVRIKQEPGFEGYNNANGYGAAGQMSAPSAQARAASLLQQQYGQQANASIAHGLSQQSGFALPGQPRSQGIQLPGQPAQQRPPQPQQYPQQQQQPPQQQRAPLSAAQTDGTGDYDEAVDAWAATVAGHRARTDADRVAADRQIRAQIDQMALRMDSGLMVPLSDHSAVSPRKRKVSSPAASSSAPVASAATPAIPQFDGGDEDDIKDEDEKDEDAINSDLDDPEEELNDQGDDEEDAAISEAILCTYDKVQRVKNKWKCTLKDGILTTKGKDYVFHKAQGEFEW